MTDWAAKLPESRTFTSELLEAFVKEKTGKDVVVDTPNPVIDGSVSLVPFGQLGVVMLYLDQNNVLRAISVPFSLCIPRELEAA